MPSRRYTRFAVILISSATFPMLLGGCPPAGPTGPALTPVSKEERFAAFEHVEQMIGAIDLNGDPAQTEQIAALLRTLPEFINVIVEDGVITAQFKDGALYMIANNRPGGETPGGPPRSKIYDIPTDASPGARVIKPDEGRRSDPISGKSNRIPESKSAILINAMGTAYCDIRPKISGWLSSAGYSVSMVEGTVDNLRNGVQNAGVLYYSGHGSPIPEEVFPKKVGVPATGEVGGKHFALWTKTPATDDNYGLYLNEYAAKEMAFFRCETDKVVGPENCEDWTGKKTKSEVHFLITDVFIQKHWRCSDGALVYIDACHSAENTSVLPETFLKTEVNASVFLGWTAATLDRCSTPTAYFFFDRALGANNYEPVRSPPQRPFSANDVLLAMKGVTRRNLPMDTAESVKELYRLVVDPPEPSDPPPTIVEPYFAKLVALYADDTQDVLLLPAIKSLSVSEVQNAKLKISGHFPETQGTVTVGGAPAPVQTWTPSQIESTISATASGPVVVTSSQRDSNARRLTQWNLTLHRVFMDYPTQGGADCPSCFWEGTIHYTIRADTAGLRLVPEGPVSPPGYTGGASSGSIDVTNAGGTYSIGQGSSITLAPNPNDGAEFVGTCVGFAQPAHLNYLGACFFFEGAANRILFSPTLHAEGLIRNYHGGDFDGQSAPWQVVYSGNSVGNELNLSITPNFTITAGQQATGQSSYFQWEAANATSPAEAGDAR